MSKRKHGGSPGRNRRKQAQKTRLPPDKQRLVDDPKSGWIALGPEPRAVQWIDATLLPNWAPADAKDPVYVLPRLIVQSLSTPPPHGPKRPLSLDEAKQEDNFLIACKGYVGICGGSFILLKFPTNYKRVGGDAKAESRRKSTTRLDHDEPEVDDHRAFFESVFKNATIQSLREEIEKASENIWHEKLNRLAYAGKLLCDQNFTNQLERLRNDDRGPGFETRLSRFLLDFELESLNTWDLPNPISGGWATVNDHASNGLGAVPALVWPWYLGPPNPEIMAKWRSKMFEYQRDSDQSTEERSQPPLDQPTLSGLREVVENEYVTILQMRLFDLAIQQRYGQRFSVDEIVAAFESHFQRSTDRLKVLRLKYVRYSPALTRRPSRNPNRAPNR